jgi:Na+/proline symporter
LLKDLVAGRVESEACLKAMEDSGLRGLGGAGFPAGRKWRIVRDQPAPKLMAVNIDEGEPGTFKDRTYLERDPHRFLEGMLVAAQVVGIDACYIYLRDEYHGCRELLEAELAQLRAHPPCPLPLIELRRGAGAYICGEESAMIESIEGKRGEPRLKPPFFPAAVGLYGQPTIVNNVETLSNLPWLAINGTAAYTAIGGIKAVIWTDVMQSAVMLGGVGVAIFYIAGGVEGGLGGLIATGQAAGKFQMVSWDWDLTKPTVWVWAGMFFATIFTQVGDQPLMQRMLATADVREAKRTVVLGNVIGLAGSVIFFFVGTALFVFYRMHPDRLSPDLPNDKIFPYFIANELPHGVVGLIIAGLLAAAMGALSSAMNATAAIVVSDFQGTLRPQATEKQRLRLARLATLGSGVVATGMAAYLASLNVTSLWEQFLRLIALIGGGFPGVFALGLLSRRANAPGVIIGTLASIEVTVWVQYATKTVSFLHTFVAIAACMVIGYIASFFFAAKAEKKDLRGLTLWDLAK